MMDSRVILAALLSGACALATFTWSRQHQIRQSDTNPEVIAHLIQVDGEVERRPSRRLIWQKASLQQELYSGEAIRTAPQAQADIEFVVTKARVHLESDSAIELTSADGQIDLDFLKGQLFIQQSDAKQKPVILHSGDEALEVSQSSVQVSKAHRKSSVQLAVVRGEAQLFNRKTKQIIQKQQIQVLSPRAGDSIYRTPVQQDVSKVWMAKEPVLITWKALNPRYEIYLEQGTDRDDLRRIEQPAKVAMVAKSESSRWVTFPIGKNYFRVTGVIPGQSEKIQSAIITIDIRPELSPQLLSPEDGDEYLLTGLKNDEMDLVAEWSNPGELENLRIQVARDAQFKKMIVDQSVQEKLSHPIRLKRLNPGLIYWRIIGKTKARDEDSSPRLVSSSAFHLRLVKSNKHTLQPGAPSLASGDLSSEQKNLLPSQIAEQYDHAEKINWSDFKTYSKSIYKTVQPTLRLSWTKGPGPVNSYRIRWRPERMPAASLTDNDWKKIDKNEVRLKFARPGVYVFELESLDAQARVISSAPMRTQEILPPPPLDPPEWDAELPELVRSDEVGQVNLKWEKVEEARMYRLTLKDDKGQTVQDWESENTNIQLQHLKTGQYSMVLAARDHLKRWSSPSEIKKLVVPEYSNVEAPKLKSLKIK